jgi:hypothetical protein
MFAHVCAWSPLSCHGIDASSRTEGKRENKTKRRPGCRTRGKIAPEWNTLTEDNTLESQRYYQLLVTAGQPPS